MSEEATAGRYARLRWVGIALFGVALCVLAYRADLVVRGALPPVRGILPALGGLALSLGSFGTANDTALHAMAALDRAGNLPSAHAAELHHERRVRAQRLADLHAAPRMALGLPVVTMIVLAWLVAGPLVASP